MYTRILESRKRSLRGTSRSQTRSTTPESALKDKPQAQEGARQKSPEVKQIERIMNKHTYPDSPKYLDRLRNKQFDKTKFVLSTFDTEEKSKNVPTSKAEEQKILIEYLKDIRKSLVRPHPDGIASTTFQSHKWKNTKSKARTVNFDFYEEPTYQIFETRARRETRLRTEQKRHARNRKKLHGHTDKLISELEKFVDGPEEDYIQRIRQEILNNEILYGKKFENYKDILEYEGVNYEKNDAENIQDAYEIVDLIYNLSARPSKDREQKGILQRSPQTARETYSKQLELIDYETDNIYPTSKKDIPNSKLILSIQGQKFRPPEEAITQVRRLVRITRINPKGNNITEGSSNRDSSPQTNRAIATEPDRETYNTFFIIQ